MTILKPSNIPNINSESNQSAVVVWSYKSHWEILSASPSGNPISLRYLASFFRFASSFFLHSLFFWRVFAEKKASRISNNSFNIF